jgi:hypothetical protein
MNYWYWWLPLIQSSIQSHSRTPIHLYKELYWLLSVVLGLNIWHSSGMSSPARSINGRDVLASTLQWWGGTAPEERRSLYSGWTLGSWCCIDSMPFTCYMYLVIGLHCVHILVLHRQMDIAWICHCNFTRVFSRREIWMLTSAWGGQSLPPQNSIYQLIFIKSYM